MFGYSKGIRPKFTSSIPQCYKDLIESCWQKSVDDRPTFSSIVNQLERNQEFITNEVDQKEYKEYINMIDQQFKLKNLEYYDESNKLKQVDLNKYNPIKFIKKTFLYNIIEIQEKYTNKILTARVSILEIGESTTKSINRHILNEAKILNKLQYHPSILKFIGISNIDFEGYNKPTIIVEREKYMDLDKFIGQKREEYPLDPKWTLTKK